MKILTDKKFQRKPHKKQLQKYHNLGVDGPIVIAHILLQQQKDITDIDLAVIASQDDIMSKKIIKKK